MLRKSSLSQILLSLGLVGLAACAAVTRQPADFGVRQWVSLMALMVTATVCGAIRTKVAAAWPLLAGLSVAAVYRMSYDPVLPEPLAARLPVSLALLEPTTPMALAAIIVMAWTVTARRRSAPLPQAEHLALRSLLWAMGFLIGTGIVLCLLLGMAYDLEGGVVFWKLVVSCALYAGLMWVGVEAAARGLLGWPVAGAMLLGLGVSLLRNWFGGGG